MVFDGIVGSSGQQAGDCGPSIAVDSVVFEYDCIFCWRKGEVLHRGAKLVAPPQATRLAGASRYAGAYEGPIAWALFLHQPD